MAQNNGAVAAGSAEVAPATQPTSATVQPTRSLADAMAGITVAENERQPSAAPVDLAAVARIQADRRKAQEAVAAKAAAEKAKRDAAAKAKAEATAKAKAEAEEKARLAANPARIWVQVATGKDVNALAFDLRRMRRTYADALGTQAGWTADWGATRRLLVGPYAGAAKAKEAVAAIKKSGGDAFIWNSEAGEEVEKIGGK
jgi:cell division septation protein DedD